ncbi:MAG TPA: DUF6541 family protein, partial [Gaiellaceae bacterium]|nr:DUF6541 family protein [Gaiellaceae bacterium]
MTAVELYLRLALGFGVLLLPGWLLARALGVRGVPAALAWSLTVVFACLVVTFALQASLSLTLALLFVAGAGALAAAVLRRVPADPPTPGRGWAGVAGLVLGFGLWRLASSVEGDGLFHLARIRKLAELDDLTLKAIGEFADASLHPGYAFPLWHGFVALVARIAGVDPEQVVLHLPSLLAPLAVVVAYEAGWALFRRTWAAGAAAAAQVALACFAPGHGGSYPLLALPATAAAQLLVPAALALALGAVREPTRGRLASTAAAAFVLAVVHPTYAIFLWIPFAGFLLVRLMWTREDVRAGALALGALVVPAALFMLWLLPVVRDTASHSPGPEEVRRAFEQYAGQLDVRSEASYSLAAEVFTRRGAIPVAALLLLPLAALAARRRWAAFVVGGSLAIFAIMLVPFLFTSLADLVSISQARRAAGFLPLAFAFAGGLGVLSRIVGPLLPLAALAAGIALQLALPGDFGYVLDDAGPAWITWFAVVGAVVALVVGLVRRGPPVEAAAGWAAALFLLPVVLVGLGRWTKVEHPERALSDGLVAAVRAGVPARAIVFSDQDTSYRLAALAPRGEDGGGDGLPGRNLLNGVELPAFA